MTGPPWSIGRDRFCPLPGLPYEDPTRFKSKSKNVLSLSDTNFDAEVLKAAANNMNLVALLGGKSPSELLSQVVRGTPLSRTTDGMKTREGKDSK